MDSGSRLEHPRRAEQVMLRHVITALPGMTLLDADALIRSARLRHLVVVRSEILVGVLSFRDLAEACLAALRGKPGGDGEFLRRTTVEHLMHQDPGTIGPQSSLEDAVHRMLARRIGCLPVVTPSAEGPRLVGVISEAGLLRAATYRPSLES
jgi:CBS domain-containing protein